MNFFVTMSSVTAEMFILINHSEVYQEKCFILPLQLFACMTFFVSMPSVTREMFTLVNLAEVYQEKCLVVCFILVALGKQIRSLLFFFPHVRMKTGIQGY